MSDIDAGIVERLFRRSSAARWNVSRESFGEALERSAQARGASAADDLGRYLASLNLDDLALACACAQGDERAWDLFIREYRPVLYRAADALDPTGGARELADSLYAELYGLRERGGARQTLFHYFHGRSSLATWLRAILSQRHVDQLRSRRRLEPLADDDAPQQAARAGAPSDPDRERFASLMQMALAAALDQRDARERLILGCYYAQGMRLAEIGRMLGEHEATVSRQLARARRAIRESLERYLRNAGHLSDREIEECFSSVAADAGPIDLEALLPASADRKKPGLDRSPNEGLP